MHAPKSSTFTGFRLLAPGVRLMRHMRLPAKLTFIGVWLMAPLVVVLVLSTWRTWSDWQYTRAEAVGARQVSALLDLAIAVQQHRATAWRPAPSEGGASAPGQANPNPNPEADGRQADAAQAVRRALVALEQSAKAAEGPALPASWPALRDQVRQLLQAPPSGQDAVHAAHRPPLAALTAWVHRAAEDSGLLLDPVASSYYLMDALTSRTLPWTDALSAWPSGATAPRARPEQANQLRGTVEDLDLALNALARTGHPGAPEWRQARARTLALLDSAQAGQGAAADALASALQVRQQLGLALDSELQARAESQSTTLLTMLGACALGLALSLYLVASFWVSFRGAMRALLKGMQAVADGNLAQPVDIVGRDELAEIGQFVERNNQRLSAMVAQIRSSAVRVGMSGQQVAVASQSLAERTETQAANLRQTVETVGQLSEAVASNAAAANDLDQLTERLRSQAESGGQAMNDAIGAMGELEGSSRRVAEIIGVIDGIAFQTNILALNAAVEAARAGEAGRGFAVVASEVRMLAQRSASAAAEIRALIARSTEQVDATVRQTRQVGDTLGEVVHGVRRVSESLRSIAEASGRQASDLEEVSRSVGTLNSITRENADMVEQSAGASRDLVLRAEALSASVGTIRLRQGSADEAHALVQRALKLVAQQGLQAALPDLHSHEQGFVDRDLYVFVLDAQGRYRVHGAKPETEGKRVHDIPGIDGDRFMTDVLAAAPHGGWVEYDIVNPGTGEVQPKASFVQQIDGGLVLGCGVYRHEAATA